MSQEESSPAVRSVLDDVDGPSYKLVVALNSANMEAMNHTLGLLLTQVEAVVTDPGQVRAFKSLIRQEMWRMNSVMLENHHEQIEKSVVTGYDPNRWIARRWRDDPRQFEEDDGSISVAT